MPTTSVADTSASSRFIVLTGGPGAGKTTLLEALAGAGYACSEEAGRGIIRDQVAIGGNALPWCDATAFAESMLAWEMRSYHLAGRQPGLVFFDRGMPDVAGYLRLSGLPVPAHVERAARIFRYRPQVFLLPPWREIFTQDAERRQSYEEAVRTCEAMRATYAAYGYQLVEVPPGSVARRAAFVLEQAGALS